ncbi:MAG: lipoyl synthase [Candidatus Omnitrophota bacterium]
MLLAQARPSWLKKRIENQENVSSLRQFLRQEGIATVCESARCPNIWHCYGEKTPSFMILGTICTRRCNFCSVSSGVPQALDEAEPQKIAKAVLELGLDYIVITSVTRDDLRDKGAGLFTTTISQVKNVSPRTKIEVLVPDFGARKGLVRLVAVSPCDVFAHNVETVKRLYPNIRPQANYGRSLNVLKTAAESGAITKSALMLGLGETKPEVLDTMLDLKGVNVKILTLGQYLKPDASKFEVAEYLKPDLFEEYRSIAEGMGFLAVASGPFVRSSYRAKELYKEVMRGESLW